MRLHASLYRRGTILMSKTPHTPQAVIDVLVIGGGQAGLAAGYHLQKAGINFRIVNRTARVGDAWRNRYDSLVLFTPRDQSALPGLALDGDPNGFATRDEFADYLELYAATFALPITAKTAVMKLKRNPNGLFEAVLSSTQRILARSVIVATGTFEKAIIPKEARSLSNKVLQLSVETYKNPRQVPQGPVLVVGDGASGRQIAAELVGEHEVTLSCGRKRTLFPETFGGKNIWKWLDVGGFLSASRKSWLGQWMMKMEPIPSRVRTTKALKSMGIEIKPRLYAADRETVTFQDKTTAPVKTIIWARGYGRPMSWIDVPGAKDITGHLAHVDGVSTAPGLFYMGRPWQRSWSSGLAMGVGGDAAFIINKLRASLLSKDSSGR